MALYPGALASFAGFTATHTLAADNHAAQHNLEQAEILAVQTKVGTGSSTPAANTVLTGTGAGTSSWAQVNLTTMVSGVLPVANGGNGTTSTTGSGSAVFSTGPTISGAQLTGSPTLTTPTIADFTNANHNHQNTAGGGQLNAANALSAGSVSFANLLATIFSDQIQTQVNAGSAGGTMWWMNLGGIKILWGVSASQAIGTGGGDFLFTLPTFFTTVETTLVSIGRFNISANQYVGANNWSTTSVDVYARSDTNGSSATFTLFMIGT